MKPVRVHQQLHRPVLIRLRHLQMPRDPLIILVAVAAALPVRCLHMRAAQHRRLLRGPAVRPDSRIPEQLLPGGGKRLVLCIKQLYLLRENPELNIYLRLKK